MNQTLPLPALARLFASSAKLDEATATAFIRDFFALISQGLSDGKEVHIKGFGSFNRSQDNSSILFTPDREFAARINSPFEAFAPIELPAGIDISAFSEDAPQTAEQDAEMTENHTEEIDCETTTVSEASGTENIETPSESEIQPIVESTTEAPNAETTCDETDEGQMNSLESEQENTPTTIQVPVEENNNQDDNENNCEDNDEEQVYILPHRNRRKSAIIVTSIISLIAGIIIGGITVYLLYCDINNVICDFAQTDKQTQTSDEPIAKKQLAKTEISVENYTSTPKVDDQTDTKMPKEPVYDVIGPKNFLATMAGRHYGEKEYWVYIYEANASQLRHPDRIKPGTKILIPDISTLPLSGDHDADVAKAKQLGVAIYTRFK